MKRAPPVCRQYAPLMFSICNIYNLTEGAAKFYFPHFQGYTEPSISRGQQHSSVNMTTVGSALQS